MKEQKKTPSQKESGVPPASSGRRFVFEFYELDDGRHTKGVVQIEVTAKNEREAWRKLAKKLDNEKRKLEYNGQFFIKAD